MADRHALILRVAVRLPLPGLLDYLPPPDTDPALLQPGVRLRVPLGQAERTGLLMEVAQRSETPTVRLRPALQVLDRAPLLPPPMLRLLRWAARYYHHPIGAVAWTALPDLLRRGRLPQEPIDWLWQAVPGIDAGEVSALERRAPRQYLLLKAIASQPGGMPESLLRAEFPGCQATLRRLTARGFIRRQRPAPEPAPAGPAPTLNPDQEEAVAAIVGQLGDYHTLLLQGVTGSGKTEVYLRAIAEVMKQGRQALVLVPEVALTAQTIDRFRRLGGGIAVVHSALGQQDRALAWLRAATGEAAVVVGTRSAVWTPLARPGLIVVDEEHDLSYKQQEGLRYHARDLAVMRGREEGIPVVLGSATPSLESLANADRGRYLHLRLPRRAGGARPPRIELVDLCRQPLAGGISPALYEALRQTLDRGEQALLFLNQRGFSPALLCHECGWAPGCRQCDSRLVWHKSAGHLRCHHCGAVQPVIDRCPGCQGPLHPVGQGTERLEESLRERLPRARIARLDRDTIRRREALETLLAKVHAGVIDVLIGTQMLAKGHDFPGVTLSAVIDADSRLYSADFRATERLAQLITQVAGRSGRAERPGQVLIQTHHPEHPLMQTLLQQDYAAFATGALEERRQTALPPFTALALLRAEARQPKLPEGFLLRARVAALRAGFPEDSLLGPLPPPMERREGRYRSQLLLQAPDRARLQRLLDRLLPQLPARPPAGLRWALDVDPMEV